MSCQPSGFKLALDSLFVALLLAVSVLPAGASQSQTHPCRSRLVAAGDTAPGGNQLRFQLADDKRLFKLEGLLPTANSTAASTSGQFELFAAGTRPDRYGRIPVQAFAAAGGQWVQGMLLRKGKAVQYALGTESACLRAMREAEAEARLAKRGIWKDPPLFDARKTDDLLQHAGEFVIVTGIVKSVGDRERRLYLNFGSNWAEDTTAIVVKRGSGAYRGDVAVLQQLEGKRVEIRGILEDMRGPLIRLIDEAQIDFTGD